MERITVGCLISLSFLLLCHSSLLIHLPNSKPFSCQIVQWLNNFPNDTHLLVPPSAFLPNSSHAVYVTETTTGLSTTGLGLSNFIPSPEFLALLQIRQNSGVHGIIVLEPNQEPGNYALTKHDFHFPHNLTIPIGLISKYCFQTAAQFPNGVNVTFLGYDKNAWVSFVYSPGYYLWAFSLAIFFSLNIVFAVYKLVKGYELFRKRVTVAFICLCMEFFSNILRVLQMVFIPYLNSFNLPNVQVLQTLALPFVLSSSILLIFFWLDLTSGSLYQGSFLSVMKIPTIISIVLLFIIGIALNVYQISTQWASSATYVMVGIYLFIHVCTAIFYFYAASKIFKMKKDFSKNKTKDLNRITIQVVLCGVVIFFSALSIGFVYIQVYFSGTVAGTFFTTYLMWFSLVPLSFLQINVFGNHHRETPPSNTHKHSGVAPQTRTE